MRIENKPIKFFLTIFLLGIIIIILHYIKILSPVERLLSGILSPIQNRVSNVSYSINQWYRYQISRHDLNLENENLQKELNKVVIDSVRLEELEKENQRLKNLLNVSEENEYVLTISDVIGKTVDGQQNTMLLNKGNQDGVRLGAPVIIDEGIIVGKIVKVNQTTSVLLLLTDNTSKIASSIINNDQTIGIVEGEHNISMIMKLIPKNELIYEGNIVITSGLEKDVPRGLVIGMVDTFITQKGDLFQTAVIKPISPYEKIQQVGILNI